MECKETTLCSLCFDSKLESPKTVDLLKKIEKYLQLKMEFSWFGICLHCLKALEEFHDFYEKVHAAQKIFQADYLNRYKKPSEKKLEIVDKTEFENNSLEKLVGKNLVEPAVMNMSDTLEDAVKNIDKTKDIKCEILCENKSKKKINGKVKNLSNDIEHKMLTFYNIKCEKCDFGQFNSLKMLSRHYLTVHKTQGYIKCCKRKIRVNDKYYLKNHMLKHLQPDSCRCRICGKELSSAVTLKHHMILHKPEEERPFHCVQCNKRFCCKNDLKNHEKTIHLPESQKDDFICDVCGKVFQKVANLRYHYSSVHLQERKYICETCAKCFTTHSGLRTHITAAHSTLEPIQCQECNKWLKTKDTFQKHLQLHQNHSYPCSHCGKICNSSASLRSHLVKHSEERPFPCTVCDKSFKTKTHLKNHSMQHGGSSPYKCPQCPKLFVNMSNFYTHRKRIHLREAKKFDEEKEETLKNLSQPAKTDSTFEEDTRAGQVIIQEPQSNSQNISRSNIIVSPALRSNFLL